MGAGAHEYLRHVAIAKIVFDNILHIQASWPTMGMGIAQLALFAGADDAGSTMMEEMFFVSGTTKTLAGEDELQRNNLEQKIFIPQKRNSDYNHLETEILDEGKLACPPPIQPV